MQENNARILIVDDEPLNLEIMAETLAGDTYDLTRAADGEEAWRALESSASPFHLVVLDRMMPGIDGMEVLRRMKASPRLSRIPVIMQTAAATAEQVSEGLQAGAHHYLTKPYDPSALESIVRIVLNEQYEREALANECRRQSSVLSHLQTGCFTLRSIDEARDLASVIAHVAPGEPERVAVGLLELLANAVEHGNLEISYEEKKRLVLDNAWHTEISRRLQDEVLGQRLVRLEVSRDERGVTFRITDEGRGFDWNRYLTLDPKRAFDPNGRGIAIARSVSFDRIEYQGAGNVVVARVETQPLH